MDEPTAHAREPSQLRQLVLYVHALYRKQLARRKAGWPERRKATATRTAARPSPSSHTHAETLAALQQLAHPLPQRETLPPGTPRLTVRLVDPFNNDLVVNEQLDATLWPPPRRDQTLGEVDAAGVRRLCKTLFADTAAMRDLGALSGRPDPARPVVVGNALARMRDGVFSCFVYATSHLDTEVLGQALALDAFLRQCLANLADAGWFRNADTTQPPLLAKLPTTTRVRKVEAICQPDLGPLWSLTRIHDDPETAGMDLKRRTLWHISWMLAQNAGKMQNALDLVVAHSIEHNAAGPMSPRVRLRMALCAYENLPTRSRFADDVPEDVHACRLFHDIIDNWVTRPECWRAPRPDASPDDQPPDATTVLHAVCRVIMNTRMSMDRLVPLPPEARGSLYAHMRRMITTLKIAEAGWRYYPDHTRWVTESHRTHVALLLSALPYVNPMLLLIDRPLAYRCMGTNSLEPIKAAQDRENKSPDTNSKS